jgi:hypothetical protein
MIDEEPSRIFRRSAGIPAPSPTGLCSAPKDRFSGVQVSFDLRPGRLREIDVVGSHFRGVIADQRRAPSARGQMQAAVAQRRRRSRETGRLDNAIGPGAGCCGN